jgi:GAF domain-containing protein
VPVDRGALDDSIPQLQGAVPEDADLEAAVRSAVEVVGELCHCSGAGLLLLDGAHDLRYVAGSDGDAVTLLTAEQQAREGPGHDAVATGDAVVAEDVLTDGRWPGLAGLLGASGPRAVLAAPVRVGSAVVGSLHVHATEAMAWEPDAVEAVRSYARVVEAVLGPALQARRRSEVVDQLQYALDHRVVVERAVGYLMATGEDDARTAFERLRRAARRSRRHVADLAAGLLAGERLADD